jgi:DnaJ-domain-containing protein 1
MLLNVTARQIGGRICLGPTFIRMVSEIEQEVREALPEWTRAGLEQLEQLAKGAPVPLPEDSRTLAHALAIDGALVRFLRVGRKASHYRVLGLDESADIGDVKAAYRRAAMRLHPDRNAAPDAAGKFIEIQRAYQELTA